MSISEKAKGKQRVVDPNILPLFSTSAGHEENTGIRTPRELVVRFTEGFPDLSLTIENSDTVKDLKRKIRDARPPLKDRRLRLIYLGRILTNDVQLYEWLCQLEERKRKTGVEEVASEGSVSTTHDQQSLKGIGKLKDHESATIWLHCSVGPKLEPGEAEDDQNRTEAGQLQPPRGFDRLVALGFSEDDIANFRRQFHSHSSSNYLDMDFESEEEYSEHARVLEEQWIDSLDTASTASLSSSPSVSSTSTLLQGVLVGFFFPLIPFFFMRKIRSAAVWDDGGELWEVGIAGGGSVVFSRRMQMGLVVGFLVNILFGMWRFLLDSS